MKNLLLIGLIVVVGCSDKRVPLTKAELMAKYQDVITNLNLTTEISGCSNSTLSIKMLKEEYDSTRSTKVRKIKGPVEITFDTYTGEVYHISNEVIFEKRFGGKTPSKEWYNKKPTKTKDEIKEICQNILQKLGLQKTFVVKKCNFMTKGWAAGIWQVRYLRLRNGRKDSKQVVKMSFIEDYGLFSYSNFCSSD